MAKWPPGLGVDGSVIVISSEDTATLGSDRSAAERHRTVAARGNALAVFAFTGGATGDKSWGFGGKAPSMAKSTTALNSLGVSWPRLEWGRISL